MEMQTRASQRREVVLAAAGAAAGRWWTVGSLIAVMVLRIDIEGSDVKEFDIEFWLR
jgi:hypothetical protein